MHVRHVALGVSEEVRSRQFLCNGVAMTLVVMREVGARQGFCLIEPLVAYIVFLLPLSSCREETRLIWICMIGRGLLYLSTLQQFIGARVAVAFERERVLTHALPVAHCHSTVFTPRVFVCVCVCVCAALQYLAAFCYCGYYAITAAAAAHSNT